MLWFTPKTLASLVLAINFKWFLHVSFVAVVLSRHLLIEYHKHPQESHYNALIIILQGLLNLFLRILFLLRFSFIMQIFTLSQSNL